MTVFIGLAFVLIVGALIIQWRRRLALQRLEYIRNFELPRGLFERLRKRRPTLTLKDCQLVAHALRHFFLAYAMSGRKFVSMPSQAVDDLWHEFILYTKNYELFCRQAFGGFLHHTPAVILGNDQVANAGLRRCWWYVCREENIDPRHPTRLPLLFAIRVIPRDCHSCSPSTPSSSLRMAFAMFPIASRYAGSRRMVAAGRCIAGATSAVRQSMARRMALATRLRQAPVMAVAVAEEVAVAIEAADPWASA